MPISVWLEPTNSDKRRLAPVIEHIANEFETAQFVPHVTLFGSVKMQPRDAVVALGSLRRDLAGAGLGASIDLTGTEMHFGDRLAQSVCLPFDSSASLNAVRGEVARLLGLDADDNYWPHMSLGYVDPSTPEDDRKAVADQAFPRTLSRAFTFDRVTVWNTPELSPGMPKVSAWRYVGAFALTTLPLTSPASRTL